MLGPNQRLFQMDHESSNAPEDGDLHKNVVPTLEIVVPAVLALFVLCRWRGGPRERTCVAIGVVLAPVLSRMAYQASTEIWRQLCLFPERFRTACRTSFQACMRPGGSQGGARPRRVISSPIQDIRDGVPFRNDPDFSEDNEEGAAPAAIAAILEGDPFRLNELPTQESDKDPRNGWWWSRAQ